ncbi:hypothetical protein A4U61_14445 [Streptomyces sp. H-KF8]|uniref:hypothetical protein n=1 Tax=Streptomyces sp. H-KF8 TaxID=1727216 RepID=UPI0007EC4F0A|nr:hypothetical protein [Streptomyces sp. H-KF8]OBQ51278.1 hypothetical protein A4U61_14445 [Streptomyces sp. H-KF8]
MGYWGYFVVGRDERPLAERDALAGARGMTLRTSAPGGWQVWEYPSGDGGMGNMNDLAGETGAPALFGYVMDSACVVVEAAAPESGAWTTCLARSAMAGYLGAPAADGTGGADGAGSAEDGTRAGLTLEDYFLEPRDAADRAVEWAAEAGHAVSAEELVEVLRADPDPLAENLFFGLLDRLGVVPL